MGIVSRQAARNTLYSYLGIGLGFLNVVVFYPRFLDAEQFGLTRLVVSITVIVAQFAQLGLDNTIIRFFPYFRDPGRDHGGILRMAMLVAGSGALIAGAFLWFFRDVTIASFSDRSNLFSDHYYALFPLLFAEVFFIILRAYGRSVKDSVAPVFAREVALRMLQLAIVIIYWLTDMSFDLFVKLYVATFLLSTLGLMVHLMVTGKWKWGGRHRMPQRRLRQAMATYGSYTLISSMAVMVLGNLDQMMIGALLGSVALQHVAYYAVSYYFGSVISAPSRALNQLAVPVLAEAWRQKDMATIKDLYVRSAIMQLVIGGFLFICIWTCLQDLFTFLRPEFAQGHDVVVLIGLANLFSMALGLNGGIISMSRSFRFDATSSLFLIIINLIANFYLISSLGIVGAAWATLFSLMSVNIIRLLFLRRKYGLWPFGKRTLISVLLIVTVALVVHAVPRMEIALLDICLRLTIVSLLYWPAVHLLKLAPELGEQLRSTVQRFKPTR